MPTTEKTTHATDERDGPTTSDADRPGDRGRVRTIDGARPRRRRTGLRTADGHESARGVCAIIGVAYGHGEEA